MPETTDILASRNRPSVVQRGQETPGGQGIADIPLPDRTGPTQVPLAQDDGDTPALVPDVANLVLGVPEDTPANRMAPFIQDTTAKKKAQALRRLSSLAAISNPGLAHNLMQRAAIMDEESVRGSAVGLLSTVNDFNKAGRHQDSLEAIQLFVNREGVDPRLQEIALKLAEKTHRESKKIAFGRRLLQSLITDGKIDQTERAVAAIDALSNEAVDINDLSTAFDMIGGEGLLKGRPGDVFMDPQTGQVQFSIPDPVKVREIPDNFLHLRAANLEVPGRPDMNSIPPDKARTILEEKADLRRRGQPQEPGQAFYYDPNTGSLYLGDAQGASILGEVEERQINLRIGASLETVDIIDQLLPMITPGTAGLTGKLNLALGEAVQVFAELGSLVNHGQKALADLRATGAESKWIEAFKDYEKASVVQAMLLSLAYSKAKAQEGGGRLTNEDFDRNARSVGLGTMSAARTRALLINERNQALRSAKRLSFQTRSYVFPDDVEMIPLGPVDSPDVDSPLLTEEQIKEAPIEVIKGALDTEEKFIDALLDPALGPLLRQRLERIGITTETEEQLRQRQQELKGQ